MRLIDLTAPVRPHWRWTAHVERVRDFGPGQPFRISELHSNVHAFTHVDAPLHVVASGASIDQLPIERLAGPAALVDVSHVGPGGAISAEDLEKGGSHVCVGDIVLIRNCWDLKRTFDSREYWTQACHISEGAAHWLLDRSPSAVGFDFPQDRALNTTGTHEDLVGGISLEGFTTHRLLLSRGILNIEYLVNLHRIARQRFYVFALPLLIEGAEGSPARVVAAEF